MTSVASDGETKRVAHMPPMSRRLPTKGRATIAALVLSRTEVKRKIRPTRPAISVCPLKGSRDSWIPFMTRLLVVDDELRGHDVAGMARLGDGDARLHVREHRTIRVAEAVLEPQVDPVQMVARASVGHAERSEVWNQLRQVEDGRERERLQSLDHAGPRAIDVPERAVPERDSEPGSDVVVG